MNDQEDTPRGLRHPGDRIAHIIGEKLAGGRALAVCGADLRLWPLLEDQQLRPCGMCALYHRAARYSRAGTLEVAN